MIIYGCFSPLGPIAPNVVIILSASSCDFRQCPWEIGSATAERAGQGEVGGLCSRKVLVGTGRAISAIFGIMDLESSCLALYCRPSIFSVHGPFYSYGRLATSQEA